MLTERQNNIIGCVVQEFIEEKKPVASARLKGKFSLEASPATIRNEFLELEEKDYLSQPHTSAGRIPTDKAYRFYVDKLMQIRSLSRGEMKEIERSLRKRDQIEREARLAKILSERGESLAICDLDGQEVVYCGLPELFSEPEFDKEHIIEVARILDSLQMDYETLLDLAADSASPQIYIGSESSLTERVDAALIIASIPSRRRGFLGLLGPKRMDYARNVSLLDYVMRLLEE